MVSSGHHRGIWNSIKWKGSWTGEDDDEVRSRLREWKPFNSIRPIGSCHPDHLFSSSSVPLAKWQCLNWQLDSWIPFLGQRPPGRPTLAHGWFIHSPPKASADGLSWSRPPSSSSSSCRVANPLPMKLRG